MEFLADYDYDLPEELIAQAPLEERSASRLLVLQRDTGQLQDRMFCDCIEFLRPGDLLVLNDTRVTGRRLFGRRDTGGSVEALILARVGERRYRALTKPAKSLALGRRIDFENALQAIVVEELADGERVLEFVDADADERITRYGKIPLPPYIKCDLRDEDRYQTVFAVNGGSAAAPTAALHFTREVFSALRLKGVDIATITLDVGIDTFRPVQETTLEHHKMHGERCTISNETAEKVHNCHSRIIAVGTTTVRTLESLAIGKRRLQPKTAETKIFIKPGYKFQIVDGMFTNFHLPRTTMLMMVSAMVGRETLMHAYEHAIAQRYRFLSFGDSMLII